MQPWKPHGYQKQAIKFMVGQGSAGLFLDPGLGKTSTTLAAYLLLRNKGLLKRMLVIAPLRPATSVWPREVEKWTDFSGLRLSVLHGKEKSLMIQEDRDVDVINPEGLPWLFDNVSKSDWPWQMLVIDESSKFKHASTQRFKTLKPYLPRFKRRYILTGTPAPNGLLDLFGQIYILDMGGALGRYITHYRNSFFNPTGYGGYTWVIKPGAEEEIYKKLKPLVLRMSAEDYLELPPLIFNTVKVQLPPEARKVYDQMEALMISAFDDRSIVAQNAAAATQKCRQIANGGAYAQSDYDEDGNVLPGKTWTNIHDAKTEAVQEIVEERGGKPTLIAYEFKHDLERLQKAFPNAPYLGGGVTANRQKEIEDQWNAGLLPELLVQPQSVAHGLNLQGAKGSALIFHSMTWNLEDHDQLIRRIWRQGQTERVVVHYVVAEKTVDEAILPGLARKDKTQKALLDALKSYVKRR